MSLEDLKNAIIEGDSEKSSKEVEKLLNGGKTPKEIIDEGIVPAMEIVGQKFDKSEIFVPEMLISAEASQTVLDMLEPLLTDEDKEKGKKGLFATVKGDQHDIGKNLACMAFMGAGYRIMDMGVDVLPEKIVEKVREMKPEVLGLSALLTTTMDQQRKTIEALKETGLRENLKIVVGGAPITEKFAKEIGADVYGKTPFDAIQKLKKMD